MWPRFRGIFPPLRASSRKSHTGLACPAAWVLVDSKYSQVDRPRLASTDVKEWAELFLWDDICCLAKSVCLMRIYGEGTLRRPPIIYWSQRHRRHRQCTTRSSSEIEAWPQVWAAVEPLIRRLRLAGTVFLVACLWNRTVHFWVVQTATEKPYRQQSTHRPMFLSFSDASAFFPRMTLKATHHVLLHLIGFADSDWFGILCSSWHAKLCRVLKQWTFIYL